MESTPAFIIAANIRFGGKYAMKIKFNRIAFLAAALLLIAAAAFNRDGKLLSVAPGDQ